MVITEELFRTSVKQAEPLTNGLDATIYSIAGAIKRRPSVVNKYLKLSELIINKAEKWKNESDGRLKKTLDDYRKIFYRRKCGYESNLPDALAAIIEAAERCTSMRPFKVQIAGALALYNGYIAEMATGEGKTLTAVITAIIWGWSKCPCHIITVNDYLAKRDSEWLSELYKYCHVSVGHVITGMEPDLRRRGYANDVTYTTSKEIVADFLRDRLWLSALQNGRRRLLRSFVGQNEMINKGTVMRGIHYAIIDEADSILIDEAVTPLIISHASDNDTFNDACNTVNEIAGKFEKNIDYKTDDKFKSIELLSAIDNKLDPQSIASLPPVFHSYQRRRELIKQALTAREYFHKDKQYIIQGDKVVIVDEFTGRLMPQRTWRAGLHQLIEAKEGLPVTSPSETLARLSFQRFFRFFKKLSGMTGTASEAAHELWHIYGLGVIKIPQNRPCKRRVYPRKIFSDRMSKNIAIVDEIVKMHETGRPVLIGTRSVKESELLADELNKIGLKFQVLNAVRHEEEALIIQHAGEEGAVTVATNMAGRGTDIKISQLVAKNGGLHVIASECHESKRIDRQLFGRCARQGDPGSARSFISIDDELIVRYLPTHIRKIINKLLRNKTISSDFISNQGLKWAQHTAKRQAYHSRKSVLKMDTWLDDSLSFSQGDVTT